MTITTFRSFQRNATLSSHHSTASGGSSPSRSMRSRTARSAASSCSMVATQGNVPRGV